MTIIPMFNGYGGCVKRIIVLPCILLTHSLTQAATWSIEIKDAETSEVKNYKFSEEKTHKLELPKISSMVCMLEISKPEAFGNTPESSVFLQKAEIMCISPIGGVMVKKACSSIPSADDKAVPAYVQVADSSDKSSKIKKPPKKEFRSYLIILKCE